MEILKVDGSAYREAGDGCTYGDGSGCGYGSPYGYGYGCAYGYGYGEGDGSGCGYGDAYGYGYGSAYGYDYAYGSAYAYGYGSPYGYGYGYGSGCGYGDGSGYSSAHGSAFGCGYGDAYGYGSAFDSGYGYGDGDGSGDGDGDQDGYWVAVAKNCLAMQTTGFVAYWKSDDQGGPANGGSGTIAKVGLRQKIAGPLKIGTACALHGTLSPPKQEGEHLWIVALHGELQFQDDKVAALEREFIGRIIG
jgi:hypothetical protein